MAASESELYEADAVSLAKPEEVGSDEIALLAQSDEAEEDATTLLIHSDGEAVG